MLIDEEGVYKTKCELKDGRAREEDGTNGRRT